jgi:hypothetical protein
VDSASTRHVDFEAFRRDVFQRRNALKAAGLSHKNTVDVVERQLRGVADVASKYPFRTLRECLVQLFVNDKTAQFGEACRSELRARLLLHFIWDCKWPGDWKVWAALFPCLYCQLGRS